MQSYFKVPKDVKINYKKFFVMKILNKRELQQIAINHLSDIEFKDFMKICNKFTVEPYFFLLMMQLYHQITFYVLEKNF